jgi:arginyl-tRNA synthetase/DNA-binding transcriptional regulator YhcF (GntR family)
LLASKDLGYFFEGSLVKEEDFTISQAPKREFGDITCNIAFKLSKSLKRSPYEIAKELVERQLDPYIKQHGMGSQSRLTLPWVEQLASVEAHAAGYINFRINFAALAVSTMSEIITNPGYGFNDIGKGKNVIVEHTSVNPNKALHVGHLRNVILGDTIYRMLKATNHKTSVLNYVDDSGLQVADIVVGFIFAGFPMERRIDHSHSTMKFDQYCGDEVYAKINKMYEIHPTLQEKRKCVLREIEETKSAIAKFAALITNKVLTEQLKTCWRIKARYDLLNFETHIVSSGLWSSTLDLLKNRGLIIKERAGKNKGCWIIRPKNGNIVLDGELEEADKVIVRSDGTSNYIAKDKTGNVSLELRTLFSQEMIANGELVQGDKMPNEKDLCDTFNTSRITIRRALKELASEGVIEIIHGKGTFIKRAKQQLHILNLKGFTEGLSVEENSLSKEIHAKSIEMADESLMKIFNRDKPFEVVKIIRIISD